MAEADALPAALAATLAQLLPAWNAQALARYLRENCAYLATLRRRAISYWNCYYRRRYRAWEDYPGCRAMAALRTLAMLTPR
ncbi:hypothetical protein CSZ94_08035 [Janthinobacterium sp. ROICE36]|uniref:hypothetical protein n=1 Tax=Janthinobacterium sp. ROICE36 TaxID=2048670 RepID=UPI000C7EA3DC|nr:hypothetical protein [Janthinobacterium sp. ROICE36]PLY43306.1 hypothetical protein CSZ94_08035 [Janthinobacterium sp. ROICE36]